MKQTTENEERQAQTSQQQSQATSERPVLVNWAFLEKMCGASRVTAAKVKLAGRAARSAHRALAD